MWPSICSFSIWIFPLSEYYQMCNKITDFRILLWIAAEDLPFEINEEKT